MKKQETRIGNRTFVVDAEPRGNVHPRSTMEPLLDGFVFEQKEPKDEKDWVIKTLLYGFFDRNVEQNFQEAFLSDDLGYGLLGEGDLRLDGKNQLWEFILADEVRLPYLDGLKLFDFFFSNVLEYVETVWGAPHTSKPWVVELKRDLPLLKQKIREVETK